MNERLATVYIGALLLLTLVSGMATWYKYMYLEEFEYILPEEGIPAEEETL